MDDAKLVQLIHQRPYIYEPKYQNYKYVDNRDKAWYEISQILRQSVDECKSRWKCIRKRYMRRIKKHKDWPKKKWDLEQHLSFLDAVEEERELIKSLLQGTTTHSSADDEALDESYSSVENPVVNEPEQANKRVQKTSPNKLKKVKTQSRHPQYDIKPLQYIVTEEHPIDVFFKSMAASVKKMSEERQIHAKLQVCQTISNLELEEISQSTSSAGGFS